MKIIDLAQNTPQWLQFRKSHVGSSDAAIIMGSNPFRDRKSLWEEKTLGWHEEFSEKSLERMEKGKKLEPLALQSYQMETGHLMQSMVAEHDLFPFISASFDGMSSSMDRCVEIKCGSSSHSLAIIGRIPPYYIIQMQHQLMVSGLEEMDYFSFDGSNGILIKVKRNNDLIKELLEKELEFWHDVINNREML